MVIPTHNRLELLRSSIETLLNDPATSEIVVVDTGREERTAAWLADAARHDRRVRWLRAAGSPADLARQAGLEHATGDLVVFLDDDVSPTPGLIAGHVARAAEAERRVVVGTTPTAAPGPSRTTAAERVYAREHRGRMDATTSGDDVLDHLWGGNFSLRRRVALDVGMVDGASLPYHEDRDFGLRCRAAGLTAVLAPELSAPHHHDRSNAAGARDARRRGAAVVLLAARHPSAVTVDEPARGLGPAGRLVLWLCRRRVGRGLVTRALAVAVWTLGRLHLDGAEEAAYRLWRRIEEQRGQDEQRG